MLLSAATVFQHLFHAVQALMVAIVAMEIGCLEAAGFVGSYDTSFAAIDGAALTTVHIYACLRARCFCRQPLLSFFYGMPIRVQRTASSGKQCMVRRATLLCPHQVYGVIITFPT